MHFFSIQSAAYAVKRDRWNDVNLAVYYHPSHAYNVDRMIEGMKRSLDYFTAHFSPFSSSSSGSSSFRPTPRLRNRSPTRSRI